MGYPLTSGLPSPCALLTAPFSTASPAEHQGSPMSTNRLSRLAMLTAGALFAIGGTALAAAEFSNQNWEIGPVIGARNYSPGMPPAPVTQRRGWYFDFPAPRAGSVHYVTVNSGPLAGARRIVVRYRVEAERGTQFVAEQTPDWPATVSVYLQRRGDGWNVKRGFEFYRWYAPNPTLRQLAPGVGEITVSLGDPGWVSVQGRAAGEFPEQFTAALRDTVNVGLVFGSQQARGHGVYATAPARFRLESFRIE